MIAAVSTGWAIAATVALLLVITVMLLCAVRLSSHLDQQEEREARDRWVG